MVLRYAKQSKEKQQNAGHKICTFVNALKIGNLSKTFKEKIKLTKFDIFSWDCITLNSTWIQWSRQHEFESHRAKWKRSLVARYCGTVSPIKTREPGSESHHEQFVHNN